MVWSTTTSTRPNSATKHRGGPLNDLYRLLTNINLELIDPDLVPKISTLFKFHGRKVAILDSPSGDHGSYFDNSGLNLDQDQYIRIPELLNTEGGERIDTLLFQKQEMTLENKNFDSIDMNRVATDPPDPLDPDKSIIFIKQIDANNDGIFYTIKKNGAYVTGQIA